MKKIRIGASNQLAIRPLVFGLTQSPHDDVELVYDELGSLALALERGDLDAALIPSIEFLRGVGEYSVRGPALVARRETGSFMLVVDKPLSEVSRIAVDEFSRTSLVILRVVLDKLYRVLPDICVRKAQPLSEGDWKNDYDGVLLTGDKGLEYCAKGKAPGESCYDISGMWFSLFSRPIVLALWAYNEERLRRKLEGLLVESRDSGLKNLPQISTEVARAAPFDGQFMRRFYNAGWSYNLGGEEEEGLRVLEKFAHHYQLLQTRRLEKEPVG
ncbi:MAG: hypothetical protein JSW58_12435 [Candidatus Latescibacterota bacterium]|nr:MAG: hypothetical protein JSW58_12435 [Candidatus Latescibacterota bacterium]